MKPVLQVLKEARKILATKFCKWRTVDAEGNRCATGALEQSTWFMFAGRPGDWTVLYDKALHLTDEAAIRLHPELLGQEKLRGDGHGTDLFDDRPIVFVNNQLGQEAILAVFDDAIAHEELRLLCADVQASEQADEPVSKAVETVPA